MRNIRNQNALKRIVQLLSGPSELANYCRAQPKIVAMKSISSQNRFDHLHGTALEHATNYCRAQPRLAAMRSYSLQSRFDHLHGTALRTATHGGVSQLCWMDDGHVAWVMQAPTEREPPIAREVLPLVRHTLQS